MPIRPSASSITASSTAAASSVAPTGNLPVEVLEHVAAAHDRGACGRGDAGGLGEAPGLENDLQGRLRRLFPAGLDQLRDQPDVAVQDRLDRRHHVDFVGAGSERIGGVARGPRQIVRAFREVGDSGKPDRIALQPGLGQRHERGHTQTAATPASIARAHRVSIRASVSLSVRDVRSTSGRMRAAAAASPGALPHVRADQAGSWPSRASSSSKPDRRRCRRSAPGRPRLAFVRGSTLGRRGRRRDWSRSRNR